MAKSKRDPVYTGQVVSKAHAALDELTHRRAWEHLDQEQITAIGTRLAVAVGYAVKYQDVRFKQSYSKNRGKG